MKFLTAVYALQIFASVPAFASVPQPFAKCTTQPYVLEQTFEFFDAQGLGRESEPPFVRFMDRGGLVVESPLQIGFKDWNTYQVNFSHDGGSYVFEFSNYTSPSTGLMKLETKYERHVSCELSQI